MKMELPAMEFRWCGTGVAFKEETDAVGCMQSMSLRHVLLNAAAEAQALLLKGYCC